MDCVGLGVTYPSSVLLLLLLLMVRGSVDGWLVFACTIGEAACDMAAIVRMMKRKECFIFRNLLHGEPRSPTSSMQLERRIGRESYPQR